MTVIGRFLQGVRKRREQAEQEQRNQYQRLEARKVAWWIWERAEKLRKVRNELSQAGLSTVQLDRALDELETTIRSFDDPADPAKPR